MKKDYEIEFYKEIAKKIKPQGFRCFLYNEVTSAWLYIITPNNSWLYVDNGEYGGYNITYEYEPSKDFGSGCRYNENALHENEITADILLKAEQYGKGYGRFCCTNVPNKYDGKTHTEIVWGKPKHYVDAYKTMTRSWCADKLVEL